MAENVVTSTSNKIYKSFKALLQSDGINEQGKALVSGRKFVLDLLRLYPNQCLTLISFPKCDLKIPADHLETVMVSPDLFKTLDIYGTKYPLLVIRTPEQQLFKPDAPWSQGAHLFLPLQQPDNMGAVLRSAAAFQVSRAVILKEGANPFLPKASRASGAACFTVPMQRGPSLAALDMMQVPTFVLDLEGQALAELVFPKTFALVVGMEGPGTSALKGKNVIRVTIPMASQVESLNASVATSIFLYQYANQNKTLA